MIEFSVYGNDRQRVRVHGVIFVCVFQIYFNIYLFSTGVFWRELHSAVFVCTMCVIGENNKTNLVFYDVCDWG